MNYTLVAVGRGPRFTFNLGNIRLEEALLKLRDFAAQNPQNNCGIYREIRRLSAAWEFDRSTQELISVPITSASPLLCLLTALRHGKKAPFSD